MKILKQMVYFLGVFVVAWFLNVEPVMAAPPSPVEVEEITDEDLDALMVYGARVVVQVGTKYYASAYGFGSGPYGIIGNRYTPLGIDLYTGGFSLLDNNGDLVRYRGYNPSDVPVAEHWQSTTDVMSWDQVWVEIFLDPNHDFPIGWVPIRSIIALNGIIGDGGSNERFRNGIKVIPKDDSLEFDTLDPEKMSAETIDVVLPDPGNAIEDRIIKDQDDDNDDSGDAFISTREIAYAIEDYAENGEKVALLLDASGSVSAQMTDIADYGEYVDKVNKAQTIIAFARRFKPIMVEEYLDVYVDSSATNIYAAINSLEKVSDYDRIIIVTDTKHNIRGSVVKKQPGFDGKIVIVCTDGLDDIRRYTIDDIENAFGATVYLCRLDNELDRIRAIQTLEK